MAQDHIIEWIGVVLLFLFGITMICQGHFIFHGKHGYKHAEREKSKMNSTRKQVESLFKNK
jgi:putative Mn2+ efflux pump MntP